MEQEIKDIKALLGYILRQDASKTPADELYFKELVERLDIKLTGSRGNIGL